MVKRNGFTLMELMVAIAIIGLLMVVAIPSYIQFVQRTARSEAVGNVVQLCIFGQSRIVKGFYLHSTMRVCEKLPNRSTTDRLATSVVISTLF